MSHEIKAIHEGALCEKYGNNIAPGKQNSPPHVKYVIRDLFSKGMKQRCEFLSFCGVRSEYQWRRCGRRRNFGRINAKTKRGGGGGGGANDLAVPWPPCIQIAVQPPRAPLPHQYGDWRCVREWQTRVAHKCPLRTPFLEERRTSPSLPAPFNRNPINVDAISKNISPRHLHIPWFAPAKLTAAFRSLNIRGFEVNEY